MRWRGRGASKDHIALPCLHSVTMPKAALLQEPQASPSFTICGGCKEKGLLPGKAAVPKAKANTKG
uniref:Hypothetical_protein n=1 Tax=Oryza glaberrima TaxID=4538 RepID=G2XLH8_ORYGL|nr:hypothetical_protein [Oryza glaberrima]